MCSLNKHRLLTNKLFAAHHSLSMGLWREGDSGSGVYLCESVQICVEVFILNFFFFCINSISPLLPPLTFIIRLWIHNQEQSQGRNQTGPANTRLGKNMERERAVDFTFWMVPDFCYVPPSSPFSPARSIPPVSPRLLRHIPGFFPSCRLLCSFKSTLSVWPAILLVSVSEWLCGT